MDYTTNYNKSSLNVQIIYVHAFLQKNVYHIISWLIRLYGLLGK